MKTWIKRITVLAVAALVSVACGRFVICSLYPEKYGKEVKIYAEQCNLDYYLVFAVIKTESGFKEDRVSKKGAIGLMQLMPDTAEYVAERFFKEDCADVFNPDDNIRYGTKYLEYLRDKFADKTVFLAAYNAGEGNVFAWLKDERYSSDGKTLNFIPFPETSDYVGKVLKAEKIYKFLYK